MLGDFLIARPTMTAGKDRSPTEPKRTIGLFQATIFGIGLILGAGIYSIIGKAAGIAGNIV
jgi:basic amino acid/polyamine antiporter, APA family